MLCVYLRDVSYEPETTLCKHSLSFLLIEIALILVTKVLLHAGAEKYSCINHIFLFLHFRWVKLMQTQLYPINFSVAFRKSFKMEYEIKRLRFICSVLYVFLGFF